MPLYDQQTSLQNQGRFSPGVNYYAGVRKPNQPNPHLEKANASFNIDLSRIGDAMIQAQDNEYKLQASILQNENAMREAEKERQLKHEQMHLEDQRYRWGKLGDWEIDREKLNVEWYKAQQTKAASQKETYIAQAQQALLSDPRLSQLTADLQSGNISNLERSQIINELLLEHSRAFPNVKPSDLTGVLGTLGITSGIDSDIKARQEIAKEQLKRQTDEYTALGKMLNPLSTEAEAAVAGEEFVNSVRSVQAAQDVLNNPNATQMQRDMAERILTKNLDTVIISSANSYANAFNNSARKMSNPIQAYEAYKQTLANTLTEQYGIDVYRVRERIDALMKAKGIDRTIKDITQYASANQEYTQNLYDTTMTQFKLDTVTSLPSMKAYTAYPDLMNYMQEDSKEALAGYLASTLFGGYYPNYTWDGEDGSKQYGFNIFAGGSTRPETEEALEKIAEAKGLRGPAEAAYWVADQMLKETAQSVRDSKMLPADAADITAKNVATLTGNPNLNGSVYNMKPENVVQIMQNVATCVDNGNCTPEKLREIADSIPNTSPQEKETLYKLANNLAGWYRLSKVLDGKEKQMSFVQAYQYMVPDNFKYLKNTQMWYAIKDDDVYIDYTQRGLIQSGTEELQKRASYVAYKMNEAGLTLEEKIEVYKSMFPNITENKNPDSKLQWLYRSIAWMSDKTFGQGAKVDTALAKLLADIRNGERNDIIFKQEVSERPVTAEGTTEITPEMRDRARMNQAFENLTRTEEVILAKPGEGPVITTDGGETVSTTLTATVEVDGNTYAVKTVAPDGSVMDPAEAAFTSGQRIAEFKGTGEKQHKQALKAAEEFRKEDIKARPLEVHIGVDNRRTFSDTEDVVDFNGYIYIIPNSLKDDEIEQYIKSNNLEPVGRRGN